MPRTVSEWRGKTDDAKIPARVRQRVFDRAGSVCHHCKLVIKAPPESWQADHVIALINGGEHRESNLAPIHGHCHIEKTGIDVAVKKKLAKVRQAHIGISQPTGKLQGAGFAKSPKSATREARAATRSPLAWKKLFAKEASQP